jgi:pyruvate/2-oxoglutarate dehydrogenase complex dihydrolipoamide acyltransferase (E2) component
MKIGDSINEAEVSRLRVAVGDLVRKDDFVMDIDSDKATIEVPAQCSGKVVWFPEEGNVIIVEEVLFKIDDSVEVTEEQEVLDDTPPLLD